jgi:hypothetical protein
MDHRDDDEIEFEADWDFDNAVVVNPVSAPGAVVSVRFTADEFEQVARQSAAEGIKLTDYIRQAAVQRAGSELLLATSRRRAG